MTTARTALRATAVLGATAALTFAGAGVALATTHTSDVNGNDVSVTFELDGGLLDGDACGAVLAQTSEAAGVAAEFAGAVNQGNLLGVLTALNNNDSVIVLKTDGLLIDSAVAPLTATNRTNTVFAEDVPSNVYALVSVCASEPTNPTINPIVLVGGPVEAIMGSVESGSNAGGLGTLSSALGGEGGGAGLDTLSSVLDGGDGEGGGLGTLSSAFVGGDTADEN